MKSVQEILDQIATISTAGNVAQVQAEIDSIDATIAAHTAAIAANSADDDVTKTSVTSLQTIFQALVDKLANAPAPAANTN